MECLTSFGDACPYNENVKDPARLHEHPSFAHYSPLHLQRLAECLSSRRLPAGTIFFRLGDHSTDLYLVESGGLLLSSSTAFGKFHLRHLAPGEAFGAAGFLDGLEHDADAEAMAETEVVCFDGARLRAACESDGKFELALYWSLWKILSHELRAANNRLGQFFTTDGKSARRQPEPSEDADGTVPIGIGTKLEIFREQKLSAMEVNFLASLSRKEHFEPGQTIFREGETGEKMYVVADGRVMISKTIPGVGEEALAFLGRGEYFGEMSLIDKQPRSADARAHPASGAIVLAVPRDVVEGILDIGKVSSIRLLKLLCGLAGKRVREIHEKLVGWFLLAGGDVQNAAAPDPETGFSSTL